MPELPEVETIKRALQSNINNLNVLDFNIYNPKAFETDISIFKKSIKNEKITSFDRRGKFLIINLSNHKTLIFHLRMEGKLYFFNRNEYIKNKHDVLSICLSENKTLVFNDVRKFGKIYFYDSNQTQSCLNNLGREANKLDGEYVLSILNKNPNKPIKEVLTDQEFIAGIGNIYADEILYSCHINPFANAINYTNISDCKNIAEYSNKIINLAINNNGSTVKSYKPTANGHGNFQDLLKVYSKENISCPICNNKIIKRKNTSNRGTSYCYKCQNVGLIIGITGKIAVGKTTTANFIKEKYNFKFINCDDLAKDLYKKIEVREELKKINKNCFYDDGSINKSIIKDNLFNNKSFRNKWLSTLYPIMKKEIIKILNDDPYSNYIIEAATLFKAKLESICNYVIYIESNYSLQHLIDRNDKNPDETIKFNTINNVEKYKDQCILINSNDSKIELQNQIEELFNKIIIK